MGDPAKDYYQDRLAAWSAAAMAAYAPAHTNQPPSNYGGGYMQPFPHLAPPSASAMSAYDSGLNKNSHRVTNGGQQAAPAYGYMPPTLSDPYDRPIPAHSSMPNPSPAANTNLPPVTSGHGSAAPLPAHMRSHPYQASSAAYAPPPTLNSVYSHYSSYPYTANLHTQSMDKLGGGLALNGGSSGGGLPVTSPYLPPTTSDPKDFSARSRNSGSSSKSNSDQMKTNSSSSQQQHPKAGAPPQPAPYAYPPYNPMPMPYNYHQNLYSGGQQQTQQPAYIPYSSVPHQPRPQETKSNENQSGDASKSAYHHHLTQHQQHPAYDMSYKPPTTSSSSYLVDSLTRPDMYSSPQPNLQQLRPPEMNPGNGYATVPSSTAAPSSSTYNPVASFTSTPSTTSANSYASSLYNPASYQQPQPHVQHQQQLQQQPMHHPYLPPVLPSVPYSASSGAAIATSTPASLPTSTEAKKSFDTLSTLKRKLSTSSNRSSSTSSSETKSKYFKKSDRVGSKNRHDAFSGDDPYAFKDDEDGSQGGQGQQRSADVASLGNAGDVSRSSNDDSSAMDFSRYSKSANPSPGPVYKFKNALLTRTAEVGQQVSASSSPVTVKSVPFYFNPSAESFNETISRFIDELETKPVCVSRRASIYSWRHSMALKAAEKEKRKRKKDPTSSAVLNDSSATVLSDNSAVDLETSFGETSIENMNKTVSPKDTSRSKDASKVKTDEDKEEQPSTEVKAHLENEKKQTSSTSSVNNNNNNNTNNASSGNSKKGTLWALPIVPKMPQKPPEKRATGNLAALPVTKKLEAATNQVTTTLTGNGPTATAAGPGGPGAPLADVWRQAFGAAKPKKTNDVSSSMTSIKSSSKSADSFNVDLSIGVRKDGKTFLDIPPEVRRRPKPSFGGLIHFSPDWERSVYSHHERCRLPSALVKTIRVHPKILSSSQQPLNQGSNSSLAVTAAAGSVTNASAPPANPADPKFPATPSSTTTPAGSNKYMALSSYLGSPSDSSDTDLSPVAGASVASSSVLSSDASLVETILENRKKLRQSVAIGRMFRQQMTSPPVKKRYNSKGTSGLQEKRQPVLHGLMPTPGMTILLESAEHPAEASSSEETSPNSLSSSAALSTNPFGNFRRQTLLRYLGSLNVSPEVKARMLDWKPEVYETKTRRQAMAIKTETSIREIFGSDPPQKNDGKQKQRGRGRKKERTSSSSASTATTPTKSPSKKSSVDDMSPPPTSTTTPRKSSKRTKDVTDETPKKISSKEKSVVKEEPPSSPPPPKQSKTSPQKVKKERSSTSTEASKTKSKEVREKRKTEKLSSPEVSVKTEPGTEPEPKKRGRKPKSAQEALASGSKAAAKVEEFVIPADALQFCIGGAATGALAAAAVAAEVAAAKSLEKEKPPHKRTPKKLKLQQEAAANDDSDSDAYTPTDTEETLQKELQMFAQDLLDDNPSWERRKVIQNLVIWEFVPVDPSMLPPPVPFNPLLGPPPPPQLLPPPLSTIGSAKGPGRKKGKKTRKHTSGLDFAKKKTSGKNSRCMSRASTPDVAAVAVVEEIHDVTYTLDHLLAETARWVIDKSAGETILHRAAKMGYPDAAAYALDMAKMSPVMKDNAGIPPIHKAAYKGHAEIVDYLLRYGSDPNTNVKGTRPLHEALEGGSPMAVYHLLSHGSDPLLYDYSGNMPIDLAEDNEEMHFYFSNILADLHGKKGARWNVSHVTNFCLMPENAEEETKISPSSSNNDMSFEVCSKMAPPTYLFHDREGHFMLASDLKDVAAMDATTKTFAGKHETLELPREDFLKSARCSVIGCRPHPDVYKSDKVLLVKLDQHIRKVLSKAIDS